MATPAQALAYKIGALKIRDLRDQAQQALACGSAIHFHDVIVGNGTLLAAADYGVTRECLDRQSKIISPLSGDCLRGSTISQTHLRKPGPGA